MIVHMPTNGTTVMRCRRSGGSCACGAALEQGCYMAWGGRRAEACESCDADLAARGARDRAPASTLVVETASRWTFQKNGWGIIQAKVRSAPEDSQLKEGQVLALKGENLAPQAVFTVSGALSYASSWRRWEMNCTLVQTNTLDEGLVAFLERLPHIGHKRAKQIVNAWDKSRLLQILEKTPHELTAVDGITPERAEAIGASYQEAKALREAYELLGRMGAGPAVVHAAFHEWKDKLVAVLTDNPYRLMELDGVGFLKADMMCRKLGIARDDPRRADAFALHLLDVARQSGHVWVDLDMILR